MNEDWPVLTERPWQVPEDIKRGLLERFGLTDGAIRYPQTHKNKWWTLRRNGGDLMLFGYGDMHEDDFARIKERLNPGEVFFGWNEHQWGDWQQIEQPQIRIDNESIRFPYREAVEAGMA